MRASATSIDRRGGRWLPEYTAIGWSNRLGWYEGVRLLVAATPDGAITGYGIGPADPKAQHCRADPVTHVLFASGPWVGIEPSGALYHGTPAAAAPARRAA